MKSIVSLIDKIAGIFAMQRISADNGSRFNTKIALAWLSRATGTGLSPFLPFRTTDFVDGAACLAFQSEQNATRRQRWARPVRSSCKLHADARLFSKTVSSRPKTSLISLMRERPSSSLSESDPGTFISLRFPPTDDKRHLVSRNCTHVRSNDCVKIRESTLGKLRQIIILMYNKFREVMLHFFNKTKRLI